MASRSIRVPIVFTCVLTLFAILPARGDALAPGADESRYLLIHLDGVSSRVFAEELDAGNLENLWQAFGEAGIIRHGVTYYPPFTSAVVMRLRDGALADAGAVIDWTAYDREKGENLGRTRVLLRYAATVPRRARSNFFHGLPFLDPVAGLALWNMPETVDRYRIKEFYWFGTDTAGHIWGEEAQRKSLRRFDGYFRRMMDNLDEDVNVIIYADHGMIFGEVMHYDREVERFLDGRAEHYGYPNIYLRDPDERAVVAQGLVRHTWQDFAFYEETPGRVVGFGKGSRIVFERRGDRIRYDHSGSDPFGYESLGYEGEFLDPSDWLALTYAHEFPYTPVRILQLFDNPRVGDVVTALNAPRPKAGPWVYSGNHHGLTADDMSVPVLVRGPDLEHLLGREYILLEEILGHLPAGSFEPTTPTRERHTATLWLRDDDGPRVGAELSFSPRYRTRLGVETGMRADGEAWGMVDLVSGYLTRFWVGVGVSDRDDATFLARMNYELRVRGAGLDVRLSTVDSARLDLFYRFGDRIEVRLRDFESVGLGVRF